jgi:NAD-dependent SIR2 family protein deacetylase
MAGVIEHVRPPRCSQSGADVDPVTVSVTKTGGYWAKCPECDKKLWLNKQLSTDVVSFDYTFPEHIGRQET